MANADPWRDPSVPQEVPPDTVQDRSPLQREFLSRAMRIIPGGTLGECVLPESVAFVPQRGFGSRLVDIQGREYIDFTLGGGSLILGHAHPHVITAVSQQAGRGSTFAMISEPLLELATMLLEAVPCAEQIAFAATGAEATYLAVRLARAFTGRSRILKFEGAYHGLHDLGMMSVTSIHENGRAPVPLAEVSGVSPSALDEVLVAPFNDVERTAAMIAAHRRSLAAVIVEPVQRVVAPQPAFLRMLREETQRHGVVLIFDEIVTGFRFDYRGAQGLYGISPDVATYGKALGGGYPVSAIAGRRDILNLASPRTGSAAYSGSQHGNTVAAAAGVATLRVLQRPESFVRLRHLASFMETALKQVVQESGVHARILVLGPVWHVLPFAVGDGPFDDHRSSWPTDPLRVAAGVEALAAALIAKGVVVFPRPRRGYVRGYLSLAHTEDDLRRTVQLAAEALREIAARTF